MALRITADCLNCYACVSDCPNEAISGGKSIHVIDPSHCTECVGAHESPRCITVCPVETAIEWDPERVESRETLLQRWAGLHPGEEPRLPGKAVDNT
ncbi:MAG: YfhL family 4Fe-4S dicluster ferredoxin [Chromatiales bacterium]|jgi:ferredoxin|nr:MAG: YfhL family 4Fe-4S dicluster ferredoxin [Chromatiales bacterium]